MDTLWTIEDPRMLREQIRIADKAYNHLLQEFDAFKVLAFKVTTQATLDHIRESKSQ